jgi:hypothetical protein
MRRFSRQFHLKARPLKHVLLNICLSGSKALEYWRNDCLIRICIILRLLSKELRRGTAIPRRVPYCNAFVSFDANSTFISVIPLPMIRNGLLILCTNRESLRILLCCNLNITSGDLRYEACYETGLACAGQYPKESNIGCDGCLKIQFPIFKEEVLRLIKSRFFFKRVLCSLTLLHTKFI